MNISPKTTADDIRTGWGRGVGREAMRTAGARRARLQRTARLRSRNYDTTLSIDTSHPTAHVDMEPDTGPEVVITGREVDQPVTDYSPEAWDWLVQRAMTIHEVGHVKYTDHDDFMDRLDDLTNSIRSAHVAIEKPDRFKGVAKQVWNALEDGAIEAQIRQRWPNYSTPLLHLRANLFDDTENQPGIADPERGGQVMPMAGAIMAACLDLATFDSGVYRQLIDADEDAYHFVSDHDRQAFMTEVVPLLPGVVADVLSEPDGAKRNQRIFAFVLDIIPVLDEADADGLAQANRDDHQAGGMPDDATDSNTGGGNEPADELDDMDADAARDRAQDITDGEEGAQTAPVPGAAGAGETSPGEDGDDQGGAGAPDDGAGDDPMATDEDLNRQLREEVADQRTEEAGGSQALLDELTTIGSMMAGEADLEDDSMDVPEGPGTGDRGRYMAYKRNSARFAQLLRQRLQKERKTKTRRGQRRGRLDSTALHRVSQGERGIKMRKSEPDEKDYAFAVVIDASGSMGGGKVREAEQTAVTVGAALEDVGADVMIARLLSNRMSLDKPFGVDMDARAGHLTTEHTGGGTPLAQVIRMTRERLNHYPTTAQKAILVITDGKPGDGEAYEQALDACTMPVIGVQLTSGSGTGEEYYHRYVTAEPGTGQLQAMIQELVQEAMDL